MPAAPVEDTHTEQSERGTAPAAVQAQSAAGNSERKEAGSDNMEASDAAGLAAGNKAGGEGSEKAAQAVQGDKDVAGRDSHGKGDKGDGADDDDTGKKGGKDEEVKELTPQQKEDMKKYAIHSELQEKLSAEIEKKPQAEWGVANAAREDDEAGQQGANKAGKPGPPAPAAGKHDDKAGAEGEHHKEGLGEKVKHMLHHDKKSA